MKLAIMQPYFMPYLGYFQLINAVDEFILYDKVAYIKKGWVNRNRIGIVNESDELIVVPVINSSSNILIQDIRIDNTQKWVSKILNLIYFNYKKSVYFDEIYSLIQKLLNVRYEYIRELNAATILEIANFLEINTKIISDTSKYIDLESHLNNGTYGIFFIDEVVPERKNARIIEICRNENALTYINPIGGTALYDKKIFSLYGINLEFVKMCDLKYSYFTKEFIHSLSIIDVLMHNGKEGTKDLLNKYTLE